MFSKIISKINEFYFLPIIIVTPIKAVHEGYKEYIENKNKSLTQHTLYCFNGICYGMMSGACLGLLWPISLPIFIGRCIDNYNKDKK